MSATGLVSRVWLEARRRPNMVILAFWYLFIVVVFEYFSLSHLGPAFSTWVSRLTSTGTIGAINEPLVLKLVLVYLTFILIVFPFSLGGLCAGIASAVQSDHLIPGLLAYFRYAFVSFWGSLGFVASATVGSVIIYVVLVLLLNVGSFDLVAAIILRLLALVVIVWWLAVVAYWCGSIYGGGEPVLWALVHGILWVVKNPWFGFRLMALVLGILIVAVLVFAFLSQIPLLGPILSMLASGVIVTLVTTFAMVLYRDGGELLSIPRR